MAFGWLCCGASAAMLQCAAPMPSLVPRQDAPANATQVWQTFVRAAASTRMLTCTNLQALHVMRSPPARKERCATASLLGGNRASVAAVLSRPCVPACCACAAHTKHPCGSAMKLCNCVACRLGTLVGSTLLPVRVEGKRHHSPLVSPSTPSPIFPITPSPLPSTTLTAPQAATLTSPTPRNPPSRSCRPSR